MQTLLVSRAGPVVTVTLHRPEQRNAMNSTMLDELGAVMDGIMVGEVRALVVQGAAGHFCAGGDIKDMAAAAQTPGVHGQDPVATFNRRFGTMLERMDALPCAVVALCEGAVMGGGFGLACVADVAVAVQGTRFRLPETSLGISPAQIAPFVVNRVGRSHARRLAVTGETLGADEACSLDLVHGVAADRADADRQVQQVLARILRNEPHAVAETKRVVAAASTEPLSVVLDDAAQGFARLARSDAAAQGFQAFVTRSPAPWVPDRRDP